MENESLIFNVAEVDGESFRISANFKENLLDLNILKGIAAYHAKLDSKKLRDFAYQFQMSTEEYFQSLKDYFSRKPNNIEFRFANKAFTMIRTTDGLKMKYLHCKMQETEFTDTIYLLLDSMHNNWRTYEDKYVKLADERKDLVEKNSELQVKLNEWTERKQKQEQSMFNMFCLTLNEKKKRIQHLNEVLTSLRRGRPLVSDVPKKKARKNEKAAVKNEVSDSPSDSATEESDHDYDTDVEVKEEKKVDERSSRVKGASLKEVVSKTDNTEDDMMDFITLPKRIKDSSKSGGKLMSLREDEKNEEDGNSKVDVKEEANSGWSPVGCSTQDLLDDL